MKLTILAVAVTATLAFAHSAQARPHHHYRDHHGHEARRHVFSHVHWVRREHRRWSEPSAADASRHGGGREYGARPGAWSGWEMRQLVGADPGQAFNLARNWAHWGRAGRAGVGAVVVWPHHVGKIVGREGGMWVIESGNDGHRLRRRPRSIAGAIAIRWG